MTLIFNLWLALSVTSWIICLFQIYSLYQFLSIQQLLIINKRYPKLVIVESFVAIFMELFVIPLQTNNLLHATNYGLSSIPPQSLTLFTWILVTPTTHFIVNIEACRLWLIQFDLNYLHSSQNEQWKTQIDRRFAEKNWHLRNKHKYGNRNYIIVRGFVYYALAACTTTICFISLHSKNALHIAQSIDGAFFALPLCVVIYTYYKCPKYSDLNEQLMLHYEFKITTFVFATGFLFYFVAQAMDFMGFHLANNVMVTLLMFYSLSLPSLVSTFWITRKVKSMHVWQKSLLPDLVQLAAISVAEDGRQNVSTQRLKQLMLNQQQFEVFVLWMYREFSFESILSFIELVQFRQYLVEIIKATREDNENDVAVQSRYAFYADIPKSSIVFDGYGEEAVSPSSSSNAEFRAEATAEKQKHGEIAHKLYAKYIQIGSEFEVNISATLRARYARLDAMNWDVSVFEMVTVFDEVIDEMFSFVTQSYIRFETG